MFLIIHTRVHSNAMEFPRTSLEERREVNRVSRRFFSCPSQLHEFISFSSVIEIHWLRTEATYREIFVFVKKWINPLLTEIDFRQSYNVTFSYVVDSKSIIRCFCNIPLWKFRWCLVHWARRPSCVLILWTQ